MKINANLFIYLMKERGIESRKALAERLDVSAATVSQIINGNTTPSGAMINSIRKELSLTPSEIVQVFFNDEEEAK